MEDNKEQTAENTALSPAMNTDVKQETTTAVAIDTKESDSNMSVSSPAANTADESTNVTSATNDSKQNLINLTIKTPKEKESIMIHADATVKEVIIFFIKIKNFNFKK